MAVAEGRVLGLGPRGQLFALEAATGRELWRVDLVARGSAVQPFYGFSASPLVVVGVLVAQLGWGGWRNRTDRVSGSLFPAKPERKSVKWGQMATRP